MMKKIPSLSTINTSFLALVGIAVAYLFVPPPKPASAVFVDQLTFGGTSTGSANAQAITIPNLAANTIGVQLRFIPGFTNTGPTQINVSGLGLVNVVRPSSIGNVAFSGGEFQAGELTCITFNGTAYQLACNVDITPIGKVLQLRGSVAPRGALIEDGSCVSQTNYAALFSVIGTSYGSCSAGLFALPDSRGSAFFALDTQGVNGAANRLTSAGSGCAATSVAFRCGAQNQQIAQSGLPNVTFSKANGNLADAGHSHNINSNLSGSTASKSVIEGSGGGSGTIGGGGSFGPPAVWSIVSSFTGISFALNGGVTQTPTTTMPPALGGLSAIKY